MKGKDLNLLTEATRSRIGIRWKDGTIISIFCHWDGTPNVNGKILQKSYKNLAKVRGLIALGNLSQLGSELGQKHNFTAHMRGPAHPEYQKEWKNWCLVHGRDRGDKDAKAIRSKSFDAFQREGEWCDAEYLYLFDEKTKKWEIFPMRM